MPGSLGNDTLLVAADSRAGFELRGGPGNDLIASADGNADTIDCGLGRDSVEADHLDTVRFETVSA